MKKILSLIDPFLIIGIVFSIAISIYLIYTGIDTVSGLLVGLMVTTVTLIIDLIARLKDSETRLSQTIILGNQLQNNQELFAIIQSMVDNYIKIQNSSFSFFKQKAADSLIESKEILQTLSNGFLIAEPASKYSFGKKGVEIAQKNIKAVSYEPLGLWKSLHWEKSINVNSDATKRGVEITRVFLQDDENLSKHNDVILAHKNAGAKILIASPKDLSSSYLESFFIVDDKILAEFHLTLDGQLKYERISINPADVEKAISKFNYIMRFSREYESGNNKNA